MARLRVKDQEDGTCVIEHVTYEHNHYLLQRPSMLVFLHSHKNFDSSLLQYVKDLQFQNVPHHTILSILYGSFGGGQYLMVLLAAWGHNLQWNEGGNGEEAEGFL
jgi:hypothetical protein